MEGHKRLNWYNKIGYGSGDLASNLIYAFVSSFVLIYLTNTVGLNAGIIGTLMMVSRLLDGVSDVFFGSMIDRTKSKMGKARPWMLYSQIGSSLSLILLFSIPAASERMQYLYFFIVYTALNALFYTASNISYASLIALITKDPNERVQLGSIRFIFSLVTNIIIASITVAAVGRLGGGALGWRNVAIIYSVLSLIINTISVFSVKELTSDELNEGTVKSEEKVKLTTAVRYLFSNKYYLQIVSLYILYYIMITIVLTTGVYFMKYVLGKESLLGLFTLVNLLPMVLVLTVTPALVKKNGSMQTVVSKGFMFAVIFQLCLFVSSIFLNVPLMLASLFLAGLFKGPFMGTVNAFIAEACEYTFRTKHERIDGVMYSCSSLGIKVGSGLGTAITGWLLSAAHYDGMLAMQSDSTITMIRFIYTGIPVIIVICMFILIRFLKVEKANKDLIEQNPVDNKI